VPDDVGLLDAALVEQREDVRDGRLQAVGGNVGGPVGGAEAAQVRRNRAVARFDEHRDLVAPQRR
jgi:hypothetical protein